MPSQFLLPNSSVQTMTYQGWRLKKLILSNIPTSPFLSLQVAASIKTHDMTRMGSEAWSNLTIVATTTIQVTATNLLTTTTTTTTTTSIILREIMFKKKKKNINIFNISTSTFQFCFQIHRKRSLFPIETLCLLISASSWRPRVTWPSYIFPPPKKKTCQTWSLVFHFWMTCWMAQGRWYTAAS